MKSGKVILDAPCDLPDGAEVEVTPVKADTELPTWGEVFKDIIGKAEGLPIDMAKNHDHYLHGTPKK